MTAYAALWMFVFSLPWEAVLVIPGVGVISKVSGMLALGLTLLAVVISGRLRRWHLFHVAALLFVIWAGCVLLVLQIQEFPPKYWTFVQLLLVVWMIWQLAPSRERQLGLLTAYVFGAYVAAFGTILVYRRSAETLRRYSAGGDANDLAMVLALALPMAWYLGMTYRQPLLRWACRAYLPFGVIGLGLTGSRGGMLASMVGLLIVPLTMTKLSPGRLATAIGILGLSGALAVAYVPATQIQRLGSTRTEVTEEGGLGGRYKIWKAGVSAFALRPLTGYGTASFKKAVWPFGVGQVAHNSYLSVLVEQGMVGFLLFLAMFVAVFLAVLDLPLLERRFALVLLATLGIAMLPLTWEDHKSAWFILAALVGLSRAQVAGAGGAVPQPHPRRAPPIARPRGAARPLEPLTGAGRNAPGEATT